MDLLFKGISVFVRVLNVISCDGTPANVLTIESLMDISLSRLPNSSTPINFWADPHFFCEQSCLSSLGRVIDHLGPSCGIFVLSI